MFKIIIDKKEYLIPNKIEEIRVKIGFEIEKLITEDYNNIKSLECKKWILAILCNCDYNEIDKVADEAVELVVDQHCFFNHEKMYISKYFIYKHLIYELQDFTKVIMKVKNYDDITDLLEKSSKYYKELFFKLYRPLKWNKQIKFKLRSLIKNYNNIDEMPYILLKSAIYQHLMYRYELLQTYHLAAFDERLDVGQQDETIKLNTVEKIFGLYHVIMQISNNDVEKFMWWLDQDIIFLFKYIYYMEMSRPQS